MAKMSQPTLSYEEIPFRRCRRCGWKGPAYRDHCQYCPGALGDPEARPIVVMAPAVPEAPLADAVLPTAALAIELSGDASRAAVLGAAAQRFMADLTYISG